VDALFGARLLKLREDEHVLILAAEHIISDAYSMSIVLRELFTAYLQIQGKQEILLPPAPFQFASYAAWQKAAEPSWIDRHGPYWAERIQSCPRVRFPGHSDSSIASRAGWGVTPIRIGSDLTARLQAWCRRNRTTLPMSVFAAYAGLVLRWCGVSEAVIRYQSNGRAMREASESVGFYASRLYLRLSLQRADTFVNFTRRVLVEYCKAYEHDDCSYLETQDAPPECSRNTFFNWIPKGRGFGMSDSHELGHAISVSPQSFENPWLKQLEWDNEPMILLFEGESEINGWLRFPRTRFGAETMERFGANFLRFLELLLAEPATAVQDIGLV
jgi:hypothetical protein